MRHPGDSERAAGGTTEWLETGRGEVFFEDDIVRAVDGVEEPIRIRIGAGEDVVRSAGVPVAECRTDLGRAVAERTDFGVAAVPAHRARKDIPARAEARAVRE